MHVRGFYCWPCTLLSLPRLLPAWNTQVYASQGFYDTTGYSPEEVIGHNWSAAAQAMSVS